MTRIPTKKVLLYVAVIVYASVFIFEGLDYQVPSKGFPYLIAIATILVSLLKIGTLIVPADQIPDWELFQGDLDTGEDTESEEAANMKDIGIFLSWIVGVMALIYLVGFIPATLVFVIAFVRIWGGAPWPTSTGYGVLITVLVYVVFVILLDSTLYGGIIELPSLPI